MVMRSQLVRPGTTFSGWIAPVAATGVEDASGRGGHAQLAGDLPVRAVIEQADPDAGRQAARCGEADLDPLPDRRLLVAFGPGRRGVAVEGVHRVVLRRVGDPGAVGRGGHAGRAGEHGYGLVPGGRDRQQLPGRPARPAELAGAGRVGLGRGVGVRDIGVDQAEQRVGPALPVGDGPLRGPGRQRVPGDDGGLPGAEQALPGELQQRVRSPVHQHGLADGQGGHRARRGGLGGSSPRAGTGRGGLGGRPPGLALGGAGPAPAAA